MLDIDMQPADPTAHHPERTAFLGVIRVLTARLACELDCDLDLRQEAGGWHARLLFRSAQTGGRLVALPSRKTASTPLVTIRKSA